MRVAHVNPDPGIAPGKKKGSAVHVAELRRALAEAGAEVVAIDAPDDAGVESALCEALASGGIDLVYERHALDRFAASALASARGIPYFVEVNAPLADEQARWRGGSAPSTADRARARERAMFASAAAVLAVSSEVARYAIERGAWPERTLVRPNAVDPSLFSPRLPQDPLRASLFPPDAFVVGFHGRLRPWHNLPLLGDALARLIADGLPVHFLGLGEGSFEEDLRGRVPTNRRRLVPWVPHEIAARYVACFDCLALSYAKEERCYFSPLKLLEAMATGAVPVVPDLGDLPEVVGRGARGLVCAPGDAVDLARAIGRLAREPELRASLASAARLHAERHTWGGIAREVLDLAGAGRLA